MAAPQTNTTVNFEEKADELASQMDRLRFLYEQYFMGREKIAPQTLQKEVEKLLQYLVGNLNIIKNTSLRFKINNLQAKFISWRRTCERTMQQIEAGTYAPHRFKMKIKEKLATPEETSKSAQKTKTAAAPPKKNATIETLMGQYMGAKQKCNESVKGLNYDNFAKIITQQSAELKKRYQCKSVKFKVIIENGKTKLKATPI